MHTAARFDAGEYAVTLPGPTALAVHVLDALGASEAQAEALSLADPAVVGARVTRGGVRSFILASSAKDGAPGTTLAYSAAGDKAARHVVFDAPEDKAGASNVTTRVVGAECAIVITAGTGASAFAGRPLVFNLSAAKDGCTAAVDASPPPSPPPYADSGVPPQTVDGSAPSASGGAPSGVDGGAPASAIGAAPAAGTDNTGGGCSVPSRPGTGGTGGAAGLAMLLAALSVVLARATRARSRP